MAAPDSADTARNLGEVPIRLSITREPLLMGL